MMTIVLYQDYYCMYPDDSIMMTTQHWQMFRSEELHAAYGKTISYVIFKEMEGAFQFCVFFVLAATVSEERLFCLIRDVECI